MNKERWDDPLLTISTPFNISAILSACPLLMAHWQNNPFYFDLDESGRIIARYIAKDELTP